jgi:hypothetical protein
MNAEDRVTYLQAIFATWQEKAHTERHWSSMEYATAAKWADRNIPLPVVLRGIHEFEGTPRRLEACVVSVEKAAAYWFKAMGGL